MYCRKMAGSALFLTAVILYSLALVLKLLISMQGTGGWMGYIDNLLYQYDMGYYIGSNPYIEAFRTGSAFGTVIGMIPSIVIAVGLWLIYAAAINKKNEKMSTTGLDVIRIISIINIIINIICAVFLIFVMFAVIAVSGSESVGIIICIMIGILILFGIMIIYNLKIMKSVNSVKYTILRGEILDEVSLFVAVVTFISGGFTAISALSSIVLGSFLTFLNNGCAAAASILFGIILISYRNRMRQIQTKDHYMQNTLSGSMLQRSEDDAGLLVRGDLDNGTVVLSNPLQPQLAGIIIRIKTNESIRIDKSSFWIGKDRANVDYYISDNSAISRRHAQITYHDGRYFICDHNSTNHVYINKNMIAVSTEVSLNPGDIINLANEEFVFQIEG